MSIDTKDKIEIYQRGYANGYKRHKQHETQKIYSYTSNVSIICLIFVLLILIALYLLGTKTGIDSNYKGNCLIDLTTVFRSEGCLDN